MIASIGEILFDVFQDKKVLGGAPFNFIFHINKLLECGMFISRVGEDTFGKEILSFLENENISPDFIQSDNQHPTGVALVNVNAEGNPEFIIKEDCAYDYISKTAALKDNIERNMQMLYYGTLAQRNIVSRNTILSLWDSDIKYFCDVNIRQHYFSREIIDKSLMRADIVKVNEEELNIINQLLFKNTAGESLEESAERLMDKYNIELLCVTQGEAGAWLFNGSQSDHFKVKADKVEDTVGAGDAYSAILAIGYLSNWEIKKINSAASDFAAGICGVKGALPDNTFYEKYKLLLD